MLTRRHTKSHVRIAPETWHLVDQLLRDQWSPEQISGWLSHTQSVRVSHEWIYQYVLRDKLTQGTLCRHLRCIFPSTDASRQLRKKRFRSS
jgi:IS30 family transposase